MIHDGHVMQRFANSNVAVIGHGSQEVKLESVIPKKMKKEKKKKLSHTIFKRDGFISFNNGGQELGYTDTCE